MDIQTVKYQGKLNRDDLAAKLFSMLPGVLNYLLPEGKQRGKQYFIGDVQGTAGESLVIELEGERIGLWKDFATDEGGDIFDLWAQAMHLDVKHDFPKVMQSIADYLVFDSVCPAASPESIAAPKPASLPSTTPIEDTPQSIGKITDEWFYRDKEGLLIVTVRRYENDGKKSYRPWDPHRQRMVAPEIRPLYNLPHFANGDTIILVEGEKCADAICDTGLIGTTAMNGANAPIDKTDWSPLKDKHVIIWPDNDEPGKQYANRAAQAIVNIGAASVTMLTIPPEKPPKWDAADAVEAWEDVEAFILAQRAPVCHVLDIQTGETVAPATDDQVKSSFNFKRASQYYYDRSPMPEDIIAPRVLTRRGMLVLGGEPKVGKSDFLLSWMLHMAGGIEFLGMKPPRPLQVIYIQAELQADFLRERIQSVSLPEAVRDTALDNLIVTPQLRLILDQACVEQAIQEIKAIVGSTDVDIIVIDPIRNVFDGGDDSLGENDNAAMLVFLRDRVEQLRDELNLNAGIILAHHTKKITKRQLEESPFMALSGASSLRSYYSTGMILYRPDEKKSMRQLIFELRNGASLADKLIDKIDGCWQEQAYQAYRLVRENTSNKFDQERDRQNDVILQLIEDEAKKGRVYTANQFADHFEGKLGLGSNRTILNRLSVLATNGDIKYFRNATEYNLLPAKRSKQGYLCIEGMTIAHGARIDTNTGELSVVLHAIKPTHYKCAQTGALLPVENPNVWVTQD